MVMFTANCPRHLKRAQQTDRKVENKYKDNYDYRRRQTSLYTCCYPVTSISGKASVKQTSTAVNI